MWLQSRGCLRATTLAAGTRLFRRVLDNFYVDQRLIVIAIQKKMNGMLYAFPTLTHAHPDSQSAGLTRRPSHHPETNRYRNPKKMNGMLSEFHYIQSRWQTRYTIKDAISNNVTKDDTWYTRSSRRDCINRHTPSSHHQMGRRYSQKSRTTLMSPAFSNHVSSKNEAPHHCTHCAWHFHTTSHGSTNART